MGIRNEHRPTNLEAKNMAALFTHFVVALLSLVIPIFIARSLGDVVFGKYSFAFTAIFAVFSDLGYNALLFREVTRDKISGSKSLFKQQTKMC